MTQFQINKYLTLINNEEMELWINDEWAIVLKVGLIRSSFFYTREIIAAEIHRINSAGNFYLTGELRFSVNGTQTFHTKFIDVIKSGSLFAQICSNMKLTYQSQILCQGFVKISDYIGKQPVSVANEESRKKIQLKSLEELSKDFERLLQPEASCPSDITLNCNGVSIQAHKTILSARSPVFAAMFAHPMKERLKNEVDITDMDESTLRTLLKFMYTGKISDLSVSTTENLLFTAEKYQLQDLKAVCSYYLKDAVSPQNVWRILVLGDLYSMEDLKPYAIKYIFDMCGVSVIENTREWKDLRKERSGLAMELLES